MSDTAPPGWAKARIKDLVSLTNGFAFKPAQWKDTGLPIVRIQNLNDPGAPFNRCPYDIPEKFKIRNGDLLFAWSGTPGTSFGAHIWKGGDAWLNQHIFRIDLDRTLLDERFIQLAINENLDRYIRQAHGGAGLAHITKGGFEDSEILVAPLNEQRRIVAKLEELFSDLDAGIASLDRVRCALRSYRASVLRAAVTGMLSEPWREEHRDVEPASVLLQRMRDDRRGWWEASQGRKFETAGRRPPNDWRDRYPPPIEPSFVEPASLPRGWAWATIDQVTLSIRYGSSAKASSDEDGVPVLRMGNIQEGELRLGDLKYLPADRSEFPDLLLEPGDLLFNRTNSAELVGKSAVYDGRPRPCSFASYLIAARPIPGCNPRYITTYLNSVLGRLWVAQVVSQQVGQANVSGSKLRALTFALPPQEEQEAIVALVDECLSNASVCENEIHRARGRAVQLRSVILGQTFEGRLVCQEPSDRSASLLLDQIKTERQQACQQPPRRCRRTRDRTSQEQLAITLDDPSE